MTKLELPPVEAQSPSPSSLYDEDTGELDRAVVEATIEEDTAAEHEAASQVERMAGTEGWKQLERWLLSQVDLAKEKLIDTNDLNDIPRLQQTARAYSNVVGFVYDRIQFLKSLREERSAQPTNDLASAR